MWYLHNVTVSDDITGVIVSGGPISSLAPGASDNSTYTGFYTLTQADINAGTFTNTATVTGTPPAGADVTDTDSDTQTLTPSASITIEKTGTYVDVNGDRVYNEGDQISYRFTVVNTGNVELTNVTVIDANPAVTVTGGPITSLCSGCIK